MFLNRGMIEAAKSEGEVAGVMAHEISHVALRHGTAQATKGEKFQIGAVAGQILGAIVGGVAGSVIAQGSNFGLGAYFLKYSREYERQADLLGAQIMARAGYDPRRMAEMFRTIESQSGGGQGPEWLSSHPNPGNRYDAILREASALRIEGSAPSEAEFTSVKSRLNSLGPAYTAEQIARAKASGRRLPNASGGGGGARDDVERARTSNVNVAPPSGRYQELTVGNFMRVSIPTNWQQVGDQGAVTFAPEGAYYRGNNGTGFTHGIQMGAMPDQYRNPQESMEDLIDGLQRSNPQIRRESSGLTREVISGRQAVSTSLRNVSEITGEAEIVNLTMVPLGDGNLLYLIAVAPRDELSVYSPAFRRVKQSVQLR
jgi:hypothetical protein